MPFDTTSNITFITSYHWHRASLDHIFLSSYLKNELPSTLLSTNIVGCNLSFSSSSSSSSLFILSPSLSLLLLLPPPLSITTTDDDDDDDERQQNRFSMSKSNQSYFNLLILLSRSFCNCSARFLASSISLSV